MISSEKLRARISRATSPPAFPGCSHPDAGSGLSGVELVRRGVDRDTLGAVDDGDQPVSTVSVFDSTNAPVNPLTIDQAPEGVAVGPIGTTHAGDVYVSYNNALAGNGPAVAVIDPATSADTTIPLASVSGQAPGTVAVSPITGDVYVTNFTDETLSVIS